MPIKKEASLLPEQDNPNSFGNRLFTWVTTVGRFIIVFTELIVVIAFLSRFWLDRKNADLSEIIRQQKVVLESTKNFENDFNETKNRLKFISDFYKNSPQYKDNIETLVKSTPSEITFTSLTLSKDYDSKITTAKVNFSSAQELPIIDFITNLALNKKIKSVEVNGIDKKPRTIEYVVRLSITFAT